MGMAEPHYELGVSHAVISGHDSRFDGRPYVSQIISGTPGGPGLNGFDGHLFYEIPTGGLHIENSVEQVERNYPILYINQEIVKDGIGSGKWDGAPAIRTTIRALNDPVTMIHISDGHFNPSKGAKGGRDGMPSRVFLAEVKKGTEIKILKEMPTINKFTLNPGEAVDSYYSSAGGYGDPLERNPDLVRHRVREGWLSVDKAKEIYGVRVETDVEAFSVNLAETLEERKKGNQIFGRC